MRDKNRDKNDEYYKVHGVPGEGGILPDGTYWNFVSVNEAANIRAYGMRLTTGRACLELRPTGSKIMAHWSGDSP